MTKWMFMAYFQTKTQFFVLYFNIYILYYLFSPGIDCKMKGNEAVSHNINNILDNGYGVCARNNRK